MYSPNLSDYRLLGLVGQGQFAQVYWAIHRRTGRWVAIKQIRHTRENLSPEADMLQRLDHPNVVKCHAASRQHLILDYCEAGTLRSHLTTAFSPQLTAGHLPFSISKHIIEDILQGLSYLHRNGIVHSDLKPENILLTWVRTETNRPITKTLTTKTLTAKISDFGCAHSLEQTKQSTTDMGSPFYAAPERFDAHSSIASDLYSVGVMIYELLTSDRPFSGTPQQLRQAHHSESLSFPATLSVSVQQFLSTALHKQPEQRFTSAQEMLSTFLQLEFNPAQASAASPTASLPASSTGIATVNFSQRPRSVTLYGITVPVDALTTLPQGCGIVTANSLHVLTPKRKLMSVARFRQPCWISVAPTGKWFVALPKGTDGHKTDRLKTKGMIGKLSQLSGHQWRRSITLTGRLLTTLLSEIIQVVAIDSRYFLRIRTTKGAARTYLECFSRRGQFVGELRLDHNITQVTSTATPYQLVALGRDSLSNQMVVLLIDLKPFQVRTIRLSFAPRQVHALDWGYLVTGNQATVLLDRNAQPITLLKGLPHSLAIASLDNRQLLLAKHTTTPSLSVVDASTLNLGLIF
ncbi:serine/threonine-protein kinase [cf. Phormidesmis sp. LEGE 11477]|uniref:serine/threonine-protein kinase n=1 Tax=cf. Phormidesmis sp. LEGE 11477 TaxID=1828680 RepID=UPI0018801660|nr:serine/threonine-protein kinase [cf. Phormidesmis sp. LEGE 11477]MBE9062665.1 serine/threonine protein kinase [cf. Phormidesmis sp. LEGE 11477]